PSGTGCKIFFRYKTADLARLAPYLTGEEKTGRKFALKSGGGHPPATELYLHGRYFSATEKRNPTTPNQVVEVSMDDLLWLLKEHGPAFVGVDEADDREDDEDKPRTGNRDNSRSAAVFRLAKRIRAEGGTYEDFVEAVKTDPETAS